MRIAKYHGTGNDFVMIEDLADRVTPTPELVRALCDRRFGVGGDGLIRIAPARGAADFFMDYWNANGEPAEMCGNGIRCLGKLVHDEGLTARQELDVLTRAGVKHLVLDIGDARVRRVTVDMGPPAFDRAAIPMTGDPQERFLLGQIEAGGRTFTATALSMGNPHCVLFLEPTDDLAEMDVPGIGRAVERSALFPNRTNVEFVTVEDGRVRLRVWERGSGETMACGTGACAALVACAQAGVTGRRAEVEFPGGVLEVEWREDDQAFLTGPAVCVFRAEVDEAWLSQLQAGVAR
jgi:diaminopimelate epimerase